MDRAARRRAARGNQPPVGAIWASNSAWSPTGYGTQTKAVVSRMIADGHHVTVASNYGLEALVTEWEGIPHLPRGFDAYSTDVLPAYFMDMQRRNPGDRHALFALYDSWVYQNPALQGIPTFHWVPIDHNPIPPKVAAYCLQDHVTPIAMSHFGGEQLTALGVEHWTIPHGIETDVFKETTTVTAADGRALGIREIMGVPEGKYLVGIVNANKGTSPVRKAFAENLLAFSLFAADKPDAHLYLHTETAGAMGGIPLEPLLKACGVRPEQVTIVNQYALRMDIPSAQVAAIYSTIDVLLAATLGEGFGLTVAEYCATGGRPIVNDFTAQPELVLDGWKVGGQPLWDASQGSWFSVPNIHEIRAALEEAYERRDEGRSDKNRQHIVENYDAQTLYDTKWRELFASIA